MNGCPIELNKSSKSTVTYLTEGVETGLSILEGNPDANVFAMIGKSNFKNINLSTLTDHVVLCLDNDKDATMKDSMIEKSVDRLIAGGKSVSIMIPEKPGDDFNDVLKKEGGSKISDYLKNTIDAKSFIMKEKIKLNKSMELNELKNNEMIKKIVSIENDQLSNFNELERSSKNKFHQTSLLQKNIDAEITKNTLMNSKLIKTTHQKIMAIEKNQLSNFDSINRSSSERMHQIASIQKNNDVRIMNKTHSNVESIKITHKKIIEKEIG